MKLYFLPIILAALLLMAVFVSYSIAVSLGHVPALLPYISDAGVLIPERSIFSQLINLAVIVQLVTFYVRFEQIGGVLSKPMKDRLLVLWNRISLWLGVLISLGLSLIGNFQLENSNKIPKQLSGSSSKRQISSEAFSSELIISPEHLNGIQKVHWTGAFLTFVGGIVWMFIQSWLTLRTYRIEQEKVSRKVEIKTEPKEQKIQWVRFRLFLCCSGFYDLKDRNERLRSHFQRTVLRFAISSLCLLALLVGITSAVVAAFQPDEDTGNITWADAHHGLDNWRGRLSIGAAFCEWIVTLLVIVFTLTFVPEFQNLALQKPKILVQDYCSTCDGCDEQTCTPCAAQSLLREGPGQCLETIHSKQEDTLLSQQCQTIINLSESNV